MRYKILSNPLLLFFLLTAALLSAQDPATPPADPFFVTDLPPEPSLDPLQDSRFLSEFFYMLLMLAILVGAMIFATRFFKRMIETRYDKMNESSSIRIIERRQLSQRTTLFILDIDGTTLLLAETPTTVVPLNVPLSSDDLDNKEPLQS